MVFYRWYFNYAGNFRKYDIEKKEWILNDESVLYKPYWEIKDALEYKLNKEKDFNYIALSLDDEISHLASFISNI